MKIALYEFMDLIFSQSFVTYKGMGYINKEGFPTGNCISRRDDESNILQKDQREVDELEL